MPRRVGAAFAGGDAPRLFDRGDEDLAVADLVGARGLLDGLHRALRQPVVEHDLDFDLGQETDDVFGATIDFGVPLLPATAAHLPAAHAGDPDLMHPPFHLAHPAA